MSWPIAVYDPGLWSARWTLFAEAIIVAAFALAYLLLWDDRVARAPGGGASRLVHLVAWGCLWASIALLIVSWYGATIGGQ